MTTVTRREIRLEVGRILRQRDESQMWEYRNTGTDTDSITDAVNLASTAFTSQQFMNYYVRHSDTTDAAPDGEKARARALTPSTGVLATSPAFTAALASGETGELWKTDPDNIDRAIDRAWKRTTRWRMTPLAALLDPDFLVDALADATPTNWAASSATATVTAKSGLERFSERVLRVALSGGDGYAGQTVNAYRGSEDAVTWFFWTLVQADVGTATPVIFDLTNTAALTLSQVARTTWAGEAFNVLSFTAQAPATCEQISVRLGGDGATDDIYYGPVCFYPVNAREFVLPARVVNRSRVGDFFAYRGNDYPELNFDRIDQPKILDIGGGQVKVIFPCAVGQRAVFYEEFATYGALASGYLQASDRRTGDAATTYCPLEYAVWATLRELLGDEVEDDFQAMHQRHKAKVRVRFGRD